MVVMVVMMVVVVLVVVVVGDSDSPGCFASGNIPAKEMRFVLSSLPGGLTTREVDRMINTVDRNKDGRIRLATFRLKHFFRVKT